MKDDGQRGRQGSFGNFISQSIFQTSGKLTLVFFCLGWKNMKLVFDKINDNLFALSQIDIFVSSLVTMEMS